MAKRRRRRKKRVSVPKRLRGYGNSCLDKLWSKKVKDNAGWKCEICGSTTSLESHHIHRCKHYGVRWNKINGACLCHNCHVNSPMSAHKNQLHFMREMLRSRGDNWADMLIEATIHDTNWRDRLTQIKEELLK